MALNVDHVDPRRYHQGSRTVHAHQLTTGDDRHYMAQVRYNEYLQSVWARLERLEVLKPADPEESVQVHMIVRRADTVDDVLDSFTWTLADFGTHIFTNMLSCATEPVICEFRVGDQGQESELWISPAWPTRS